MVYPLRIYRMHDFELMMLASATDIPLQKTIKTILHSYVQGKIYHIDVSSRFSEVEPKDLPYIKMIRIQLNDESDADIIRMLANIKDGYKNSFIKSVIKMYIMPFSHSMYYIVPSNCPVMDLENSTRTVPALKKGVRQKKISGTTTKPKNTIATKPVVEAITPAEKKVNSSCAAPVSTPVTAHTPTPTMQISEPVITSPSAISMPNTVQIQSSASSVVPVIEPVSSYTNAAESTADIKQEKPAVENNENSFDFFAGLMG